MLQDQQATLQLPPGKNLQIVDDYHGEIDLKKQYLQNSTAGENRQQRRYPLWSNQRRPGRYHDKND